jgi:hypothetical protein
VRELKGRREVPFGTHLIPLNATGPELPYQLRKGAHSSDDYWLQLIGQARKRLYLAGIGFASWKGIHGMKEALREAGASGCEIRVLTLDPKNPAYGCLFNPDVTASSPASLAARIAEARSWFKDVLGGVPNSDVRALEKGTLFQQIVVSDDNAIICPYLFSASNRASIPRLDINERCPVFDVYLGEFEVLWQANSSN